jgi:hypothetical protein
MRSHSASPLKLVSLVALNFSFFPFVSRFFLLSVLVWVLVLSHHFLCGDGGFVLAGEFFGCLAAASPPACCGFRSELLFSIGGSGGADSVRGWCCFTFLRFLCLAGVFRRHFGDPPVSLVVPVWWGCTTFQSFSVSWLYCSDGFGGWRLRFWLDLAKLPLFLRGGDGVAALMVAGGADMEVGYWWRW